MLHQGLRHTLHEHAAAPLSRVRSTIVGIGQGRMGDPWLDLSAREARTALHDHLSLDETLADLEARWGAAPETGLGAVLDGWCRTFLLHGSVQILATRAVAQARIGI